MRKGCSAGARRQVLPFSIPGRRKGHGGPARSEEQPMGFWLGELCRGRVHSLFQLFAVLEGGAHPLSKDQVGVVHRVEGDGAQFGRVDLPVVA